MALATRFCKTLLAFLLFAVFGSAHLPFDIHNAVFRSSLPTDLELKVLPIGDSITFGVGSTDGNSYRLELMSKIKAGGRSVSFIGTQHNGQNNPDNANEGYGGNRISQILDHMRENNIIQQKPNLVLIHAGTNDNDFEIPGESYSDASDRLGTLIDYVTSHTNAVVLVAQLIGNAYNQSQTDSFNRRVPEIVRERYTKGYKVHTVDMSSVRNDYLADLLHPNDKGYKAMADLWYKAILDIPVDWWKSTAVSATTIENGTQNSTTFTPAMPTNVAPGLMTSLPLLLAALVLEYTLLT